MDSRPKLELPLAVDPCACREVASGSSGGSCAAKLTLSCEEEAVLRQMRQLHAESRAIRQELKALPPERDPARHGALLRRLEALRARFAALRQELARANTLKLQRLGHEP